jgi:hypothetical protein
MKDQEFRKSKPTLEPWLSEFDHDEKMQGVFGGMGNGLSRAIGFFMNPPGGSPPIARNSGIFYVIV